MLICGLTLGLVVAGASVVGETTVREQRASADLDAPGSVEVGGVVDAEGAVLAAPGVSLARDGGPLSSARPLLRGLSGARLVVDVAGVPFVDPAAGVVDVALLPLGLGRVDVDVGAGSGVGGGLSVRPVDASSLQFVVGDLGTLLLRGRASLRHDSGRALFLVDAGSTRGAFRFTATDSRGDDGPVLVRANNDHRRLKLASVVDGSRLAPSPLGGQLQTRLVGVLSLHEGGVPGFATAPFVDLRASTVQGVVGGEVAHVNHGLRVRLFGDVGGSDRRTWRNARPANDDVLAALSRRLGLGLRTDAWRDERLRVVVDTSVQGTLSFVTDVVDRTDLAVAASVDADLNLGVGHVVASVSGTSRHVVDISAANVSSVDVAPVAVPAGRARLGVVRAVDDTDGDQMARAGVFVGVAHSSRAATLDERFAPRGFVNGTADLSPERISDLEVGGTIDVGHIILVTATAFGSRLDDAIVYVNKNAFEVAPQNTGPAQRLGIDLGVRATPVPFVRVDIAGSLLHSHVDATNAPLPTAPPLVLRTALHLGDEQGFFEAVVVGRGAAPSTIFGTLPSPAYALLNLLVHVPLNDVLALTATIDNALDVTTAKDSNLLPLPGRLAFVGFEVRP